MTRVLLPRKDKRPIPAIPAGIQVRCRRCDALLETTQATEGHWVEEYGDENGAGFTGWYIRCPECGNRKVRVAAPRGVSR